MSKARRFLGRGALGGGNGSSFAAGSASCAVIGKEAPQVGHLTRVPAAMGLKLFSTFRHAGQANVNSDMTTSLI
jgi:hypothetical protein